ncbi:uncharacterized protein [Coffea arabica]|uniref:Uncharacterized protein isoform X1 n=2 Tax=Coffea arabica TaxID=13443 RepID=A0ABM4WEE6_COFAR
MFLFMMICRLNTQSAVFCLDLPVFSLSDKTDIPSTSAVSAIDSFCSPINDDSVSQSLFHPASSHVHVHQFPLPSHSASSSTIKERFDIATSSRVRAGNHRRPRNIPLIQQIQSEPSILPSVPDCIHCHAKRFYMEPPRFCCASGEIRLAPTKMADKLVQLYKANTPESKEFRQCIRSYNNMFAFTSLGVHYNKELSKRNHGIYTFRVQGQIYHFINSLVPSEDEKASNLQLYFYDTEHELANRMAISSKFRESIVEQLRSILHENPYSAFIRSLAELQDLDRYRIFLKSDPGFDQRVYNAPTVSQVAAIWSESDLNDTQTSKNIEISTKTGSKKIVKQYYGCYDALQYPLIYARGETGWHPGILRKTKADILDRPNQTCSEENLLPLHQSTNIDQIIDAEEKAVKQKKKRRPTVSCREYYAYKFQIRNGDQSNLLHISRLLQQYSVDTYVKLETSRLEFYRSRQNKLRTEAYQGLLATTANGETNGANVGKRIILPASFIGGPRDMHRRYMDAMELVQRYGKPDIFLTITCNPSWPEIKQHLGENDETQNRPDLIARVFRAKIEQLKEDLLKKHIFGQVAAYTYVIEFQKRGLPHAHFLIILKDKWKMHSPEEYDRIVSAELPDRIRSPYIFSLVVKHMLHGPCGSLNPKSPCMRQNKKCKNNYPKDFCDFTKHGKSSYPLYRRRDDGNSVMIRDHQLDNRWIIHYNAYLLAKYDCHINVEVCSAIEAVKYIYKYIYKGHD